MFCSLTYHQMIHLRKMTDADVSFCMRLKDQAGWNQTEDDWRRFLTLEPDGCFVAELDGRPVGTATTCVFDSVGWIAMVLVDEPSRHQGVGTRLVEDALVYLDARGVRTARLDATRLGRPIYEKLGFVAEYDLARMEGTATGAASCDNIGPATPEKLDAVLQLDRQITGTNRRRLIEALFRGRPKAMRIYTADEKILGYLMLRAGSRATQIGPAVALTDEAGRALADEALQRHKGQPVFIDVPVENRPAITWAESHGLIVQRPLIRMRRGDPVADDPTRLWASSGPEKG